MVDTEERIYAVTEFSDGNTKDVSSSASYNTSNSSVASVDKDLGRADVEFHGLGIAALGAGIEVCQWRRDFNSCEPLAGGGMDCDCECLPISLTVPEGSVFGSLSPPAEVLVNQVETDEIVVVAWVNAAPIVIPSGASFPLVLDLNDPVGCPVILAAWALNNPMLIVSQTDRDYANAWLLKNSGNSRPPTFIDPVAVKNGGDYRAFSRFKVRLTSFGGQISTFSYNAASSAVVGDTPNPCPIGPAAGPEVHSLNEARGVTAGGQRVYQLNQGRLGSLGQAVDRTLNYPNDLTGTGTPWIWSTVKFNADGTFAPLDHQIFPTYYVYRNAVKIQEFPQSAPEEFIAFDATSERLLNQIN